MKTLFSIALICISLFQSGLVVAQSNTVAVFLFKGDIKMGPIGKTTAVLQIGRKLGLNDIVQVGKNSEVVFSKDGELSSFTQLGTYSYDNVASRFAPGKNGLSTGIVDFISQSITEVDENYLKKPEQYLKETGNVSRTGPRTCFDSLMFVPFDNCLVIGDSIVFRTHNIGKQVHELLLFADGKPIFSKKFSDSSFVITKSEAKLAAGKKYTWFFKVEDPNNCKRNAFYTVTPEKEELLLREIVGMKANSSGNGVLDGLSLAGYYEKRKLFTEANDVYQGLIKTNKDREDIKQHYIAFLVRMNEPRQAALVK